MQQNFFNISPEHNIQKILVTGASGFVGSNLCSALTRLGFQVKALIRNTSNLKYLKELDVEFAIGDITDKSTLYPAMRGCDIVFHTAAVVAMWKGKEKEQHAINVSGTRNIVEVALDVGIRKLVHTSSVATFGWCNTPSLIDENYHFNIDQNLTYNYTKFLAEKEILSSVEKGLNAVIVNPTIVIGPGDYNFHGGSLIKNLKKHRLPFYINGGLNISFIDDIVNGHISAAFYGRKGEKYILGGHNLTIKEALIEIAEVIGVKPPSHQIPDWLIINTAKLFDVFSEIFKLKPLISSNLTAYVGKYLWVSSEKAVRELNYKITPFKEAVKITYEWYLKSGLI